MKAQDSIVVIGAGIGGLAIAGMLKSRGFDVNLYEQAPSFARIGSGIQVSPNSVKVLRALGLEERVRAHAFEPRTFTSREYDTGKVTNLHDMSDNEALYGAPYLLMHRADLHEALWSAVPDEIVHRDKKLADITEAADHVALSFEDGTVVKAGAVIAVDGVHSLIRSKLFKAEPQRFTQRVAYRTTFPASLLKHEVGDSTKWWGPDRHIVIYYTTKAKDEVYFVTSGPQEGWERESWSLEGSLDDLRRDFADFHPEVRMVLDACPKVYKWALFERGPLPTWHSARTTLLGDACHPMMPYMAQGATMALEDAAVLARCMDELEGSDYRTVFARFEAARHARTSEIQRISSSNSWMRGSSDPAWVYGYNATSVPLPALDAVAPAAR